MIWFIIGIIIGWTLIPRPAWLVDFIEEVILPLVLYAWNELLPPVWKFVGDLLAKFSSR